MSGKAVHIAYLFLTGNENKFSSQQCTHFVLLSEF